MLVWETGVTQAMRTVTYALSLLLLAVGIGLVFLQSPGAARHNFSMLQVHSEKAAPGDEVRVSGYSYTETAVVRFGALDGRVLGRLEPTDNDDIEGTVRIPPDTEPGRHILYAMHEDADGNPTRFPGQAAITVVGEGGAPLDMLTGFELEPRPAGLLVQEAPTMSELVVVALAAAGAAGLLTALVTVVVSRPRRAVGKAEA